VTLGKFSSIWPYGQIGPEYLRKAIYDENLDDDDDCRFSSFLSPGTSLTWAPVRLLTGLSAEFSHRSVIFLSDRVRQAW